MLIAIEGADGTGTTTQVDKLAVRMMNHYGADRVWKTFEPSDGQIGRLIRKSLRGDIDRFHNDAIRHLFRADRIEHFRNEIRPRLMSGDHVITDRYLLSTLVYQTVADLKPSVNPKKWPVIIDEMKKLWREMLNRDDIYDADLTIVLHLDPDKASGRIDDRNVSREIYEKMSFQRNVSNAYRLWTKGGGGDIPFRYFLVDADSDVDTVTDRCLSVFEDRFGERL